MKILYIGQSNGTSLHRFNALVRLGHNVLMIDPYSFYPRYLPSKIIGKWRVETGGLLLNDYISFKITNLIENCKFDIALINQGELIDCSTIKKIKSISSKVINYINDDPLNIEHHKSWKFCIQSLPYYDLVVVPRDINIEEAYKLGAKRVLRDWMSADEEEHKPRKLSYTDYEKWSSDILFVGTHMPERGLFLSSMIDAGLSVTIYGERWQKSPEWKVISKAWKGIAIYGEDYAKAIQSAKICLGLLSKSNRDLYTTRSMEIPYLGGLLCAERTSEHQGLYEEGEEAVFWSDSQECITVCNDLLLDEVKRTMIARRGQERAIKNKHLNQVVMQRIIDYSLH